VLLDRQEPQELDRLVQRALRVGKAPQVLQESLELMAQQVLQESLELMAQQVLQEPLVDKVAQEPLVCLAMTELQEAQARLG
jgi:hypothetical protein